MPRSGVVQRLSDVHALRYQAEDCNRRHEEDEVVELVEISDDSLELIDFPYGVPRVCALFALRTSLNKQSPQIW